MVNKGTSSPATKDVEPHGHRTVAFPLSKWRSWLIPLATILGFAIPAVSYLWMVHTYGVNVIVVDQWDDITLIGQAFSGTLHLSTLWAQHNENRIFFPNMIVLALAYTTHLNVVTEEYLSALMLFGATALVICAHKRRSPERWWIWYCPVAFLMLSLAQANNALWGFQMAWYLVLFMSALALFLLDHESQQWPIFAGAIAAALIASFSSLQGLLVWPAGLLLIYLRRRPGHLAIAWIVSAVLAGVMYFVGFNFNTAPSAIQDPAAVLTFFIRVVGDVVGESQPGGLVTLFGSVLVVTAIWALARFAVRERTTTGGRPLALSLILLGLLFSALTALGRGSPGSNVEYRYTVFSIFVLVGLYLVILDPPLASELRSPEDDPRFPAGRTGGRRQAMSDLLFTLARVIVGVGIVITVIIGSDKGLAQARMVHAHDLFLGQVIVRANSYPDPVVKFIDSNFESARSVRHQITIAREDHLSLFGTGDAARYLSERPLKFRPFPPPHAELVLPRNHSTLHGKQILGVIVMDSYDITRVDFFVTGTGYPGIQFTGVAKEFWWQAKWNTSTVPNGSYTIEASVDDSRSLSVRTLPVEVRVENVKFVNRAGHASESRQWHARPGGASTTTSRWEPTRSVR
jgi:hypothetical protein